MFYHKKKNLSNFLKNTPPEIQLQNYLNNKLAREMLQKARTVVVSLSPLFPHVCVNGETQKQCQYKQEGVTPQFC